MKKKDSNPLEKKKKQLSLLREKLEEKVKDKKPIKQMISSEQLNPLIQSSNLAKDKIGNSTEFSSSGLARKKSVPKYKINKKLLEEKFLKKNNIRVFSHSPDKINFKINENKPKLLQKKLLTERKFIPTVKNEPLKSSYNLKVQQKNDSIKNSHKNSPKKNIGEKNLQDLNSHYGKIAGYIDSAGEDTASALKIYLGEQAANYILALASFESDAVKPYTESEVIRFIRFCKSKRARLVKASAGVFGVPGTVSLIKKLILKR